VCNALYPAANPGSGADEYLGPELTATKHGDNDSLMVVEFDPGEI
jgi:hypothetical protein